MNAKDAWRATLGQLQVQLNRSTYDTWLRRAELLGYEDGRFVVTVPNAYARDWIERHLLTTLTQTLSKIFQSEVDIQIIVWDPVEEPEDEGQGPLFAQTVTPSGKNLGLPLNPDYTFKTFLVGDANRYPALLGQAIVESTIGKYSPSYFHGEMGVGKTHLLQAIAQALIERGYSVVYITAEEFTNEMVGAIRGHTGPDFREKYRAADAVLMDDLQFVDGKEGTQSELVAVWDALRTRQRAMIFASDRLPHEMPRLSRDARSRFQAGPIATLELPDLALRKDILAAKSARHGVTLPPEARDLLAERLPSNVRELEGAIDQLSVYARLTGSTITTASVAKVLGFLGASTTAQPLREGVTLDSVIQNVALFYRVPVPDLSGRGRTKIVTHARQIAMFLARELTNASLPQIGDALGGRNHSTVVHGCARVAELTADPQIAQELESIRHMIAGTPLPEAVLEPVLVREMRGNR